MANKTLHSSLKIMSHPLRHLFEYGKMISHCTIFIWVNHWQKHLPQ